MILQLNKKYYTRCGFIVIIRKIGESKTQNCDGEILALNASITDHYTKVGETRSWESNGNFYANRTTPDKMDLVKEYDEEEALMQSFNKQYAIVFRHTPLERFRSENFDDLEVLNKKFKKLLRRCSYFKIFKRVEEGKYTTMSSKHSLTESFAKIFKETIEGAPEAQKIYRMIQKYNDIFERKSRSV